MAMSVGRALSWGFAVALAVAAVTFIAAFAGGFDINVPGILELNSSPPEAGPPQTSMLFNPLAPIVLALIVAASVWGLSHLNHRHRGGREARE